MDTCSHTCGQYPGQVFQNAAPGDVRHGFDADGLLQCKQRLVIDRGGGQQCFAQTHLATALLWVSACVLKHLANEGVAVGMWAAGRQGDQRVTGLDRAPVNDVGAFYNADAETRQIVICLLYTSDAADE